MFISVLVDGYVSVFIDIVTCY